MIPASPVPSVCTTRLRPAANALLTARHALDAGAVATARRALAHAAGVVRYTRQQARAWSVPAASRSWSTSWPLRTPWRRRGGCPWPGNTMVEQSTGLCLFPLGKRQSMPYGLDMNDGTKVSLVSDGDTIAVRINGTWHDPYGGRFSARDIEDMDRLVAGEIDAVEFGAQSVRVVVK